MPPAINHPSRPAVPPGPGCSMDIHSLDGAVQAYFAAGIADSTHKTYGTAEKRFTKLRKDFSLSPYPVNESILCYFVACLGQQGLTAATIKMYLSGMRQIQIAGGFPDPNSTNYRGYAGRSRSRVNEE